MNPYTSKKGPIMDTNTIQNLRKKANDRRHTDKIARFLQVMAGKIQY